MEILRRKVAMLTSKAPRFAIQPEALATAENEDLVAHLLTGKYMEGRSQAAHQRLSQMPRKHAIHGGPALFSSERFQLFRPWQPNGLWYLSS